MAWAGDVAVTWPARAWPRRPPLVRWFTCRCDYWRPCRSGCCRIYQALWFPATRGTVTRLKRAILSRGPWLTDCPAVRVTLGVLSLVPSLSSWCAADRCVVVGSCGPACLPAVCPRTRRSDGLWGEGPSWPCSRVPLGPFRFRCRSDCGLPALPGPGPGGPA